MRAACFVIEKNEHEKQFYLLFDIFNVQSHVWHRQCNDFQSRSAKAEKNREKKNKQIKTREIN